VGFWLSSCTYIHHIISFVQTTSYQQTSLFTRLQVTHVIPVHRNTETTSAHCFSHCRDQSIVQFQKAAVAIREGEVQRHEGGEKPVVGRLETVYFRTCNSCAARNGAFRYYEFNRFPITPRFLTNCPSLRTNVTPRYSPALFGVALPALPPPISVRASPSFAPRTGT